MDFQGISALIVALTGALAVALGSVATRRGKAEERRQQSAADQALGDKTRLDETQQALDATERRAERAEAGEERWRTRAGELDDELDNERARRRRDLDAERDRHRRALAEQEARCKAEMTPVFDAVATLRDVVVDEIARAAAGETVAAVRAHPHDPVDLLHDT